MPPQNSPLAWQADPWYSRVDPGGQPWEVGLKLVRMGGDACVALAGGGTQAQEPDEGDATAQGVPSLHNPSPAPTETKALPRRHHKIPTPEGAGPAPTF